MVRGAGAVGDGQRLPHLDAKNKLTIALPVAEAEGGRRDLTKWIQTERVAGSRIYEHLRRIGCAYITTNYDRLLDRDPIAQGTATPGSTVERSVTDSSEPMCWPRQFTVSCLRVPDAVFRLHRNLAAPESEIVTTPDRLRHC